MMKIISKNEFEKRANMMDEACRQWYAFVEDDPGRADGEGFSTFYEQLCAEKYEEYRQFPNDFDLDAPVAKTDTLLLLNAEQGAVLNASLSDVICNSTLDSEEKALLKDILNRLQEGMNENEGMVM